MQKYLLDTNSIIYYLQGYKELDEIFEKFVAGIATPMISIITEIELFGFPGITSKEEKFITKLLANFQILDVNKEISKATINLRRQYKMKVPDAIIAATAMNKGAILVTRDEEDFKKIKHLVILNPFISLRNRIM